MNSRKAFFIGVAVAFLLPVAAEAVRPPPAGIVLWSYATGQNRTQGFEPVVDYTTGNSSVEMEAVTSKCTRLTPAANIFQQKINVRRTYRPRATTIPDATINYAVSSAQFVDPSSFPGAQYFSEDGQMVAFGGLSSPLLDPDPVKACKAFPVSYRESRGIANYGATEIFVESLAVIGAYRQEIGNPLISVSRYYVGAFNKNGTPRWAKLFASPDAGNYSVVVGLSSVADHLNRGDGQDELLVVRTKPTVPPTAAGLWYNYSYFNLSTGGLIPPATVFMQALP